MTWWCAPPAAVTSSRSPCTRARAPLAASYADGPPDGEISVRPTSSVIGSSCQMETEGPQPALATVVPSADMATAWAFVSSATDTCCRTSASHTSSDRPTVTTRQPAVAEQVPLQAMALTGSGTAITRCAVLRSQMARRPPPMATKRPVGSTAVTPVAPASLARTAPVAGSTIVVPVSVTRSSEPPSAERTARETASAPMPPTATGGAATS